jgi:hypothetical protein
MPDHSRRLKALEFAFHSARLEGYDMPEADK